MSNGRKTDWLTRYPSLAALGYLVVVLGLIAAAYFALDALATRRATIEAASDMLARLEGRSSVPNKDDPTTVGPVPPGSPFLEGETVTVAGASLLQRIAGAVTKVGGNVLSSQVELEGTRFKEGYIGLVASCEIEQSSLQQLLYDLEAGMPFLFIDQLVIQAPTAGSESSRMRLVMSVSGRWGNGK